LNILKDNLLILKNISENCCLQKAFMKNFFLAFDYHDILDIILLRKLTLCHNFYIGIKLINDSIEDFKTLSKSIFLFSNEEMYLNKNFMNVIGDLSVFHSGNVYDYKHELTEKNKFDKLYILKNMCCKFIVDLTKTKELERRLDSHSYSLLLVVYNM